MMQDLAKYLPDGRPSINIKICVLKSRDITLPTKVHVVKAMVFPVVIYGCESWTIKKLSAKELMFLNCGVGEDSWVFLGLQGDPASPSWRRSVLDVHWRDWCWSWNSNTLATWCRELTHLKRPWCWERLRARGEGDDRGWDGWMASWHNGHGFGWTPGVGDGQGGLVYCGSLGCKKSDTTERLNWTELNWDFKYLTILLTTPP